MHFVRPRSTISAVRESLNSIVGATATAWNKKFHSTLDAIPIDTVKTSEENPSHEVTSSSLTGRRDVRLDPMQVKKLEGAKAQLYNFIRQPRGVRDRSQIETALSQIRKEFPPCMYVFNILLHAGIMLNDREEIQKILRKIRESGLELNLISYNLLIGYYRNMGHPEESERLMRKMMMAGINPTRVTYTTLVAAFSKQDTDKARRYFDAMRASIDPKDRPDIFAYNAIIESYLLDKNVSEADRLFKDMQEDGIKPNAITYKILIESLLKTKVKEAAWSMYETALGSAEVVFSSRDLAELCQHFWQKGDPQQALKILEKVEPKQLTKPLSSCLLSALVYAMREKDKEMSLLFINRYLAPKPNWFLGSSWLLLESAKFDHDVLAAVRSHLGPFYKVKRGHETFR